MTEREQFFALYWGQKVMYCTGSAAMNVDPISVREADFYLLLTPLDQITDEHGALASSRFTLPFNVKSPGTRYLPSDVADLLRSLGYAVPYKQYSVTDLVQMGWVKLKQQ